MVEGKRKRKEDENEAHTDDFPEDPEETGLFGKINDGRANNEAARKEEECIQVLSPPCEEEITYSEDGLGVRVEHISAEECAFLYEVGPAEFRKMYGLEPCITLYGSSSTLLRDVCRRSSFAKRIPGIVV